MEVMKMTRLWKIIAVVATSAYLLQYPGCFTNTGNGFNFLTNIPGGQSLAQILQQYGLTT